MQVGTPTFDQLQILATVADCGSFTAAGRRLNRATSAIAYGIDNLEEQLGVLVFDRSGTKKPELTEAGRALLAQARSVLQGMDKMRAKAASLREGEEAEVSLVADVMLPTARLVDALQGFQVAYPTVQLRLHAEALGAVTQLVADGTARLGINCAIHSLPDDIDRQPVGHVRLIPVASPSHPLARARRHSSGDLREHIQLVLTDRSPLTRGQDFGVVSNGTWRLADLGVKHALLLAAIGWGSMPDFMVRADLDAGRLVELDVPGWKDVLYPLQAIWRVQKPPGPATQWLIDRFAAQM
ncbi:LysR family transcriptional regulator [Bradyrhizobium sp. BRP22]|uniref:LysR family transcriptional regulator n=1 Tax=Bradyrhizobium sp. BRP22 TaxID=2793821 RepID=UPI001CD662CC|nr:LysR family transcriptional regulator [Bradyrhizobium sp. BRP22]MCA1457087.1 LysR family transcriptional regulator [Bradyrhizobium sp. BRP22]